MKEEKNKKLCYPFSSLWLRLFFLLWSPPQTERVQANRLLFAILIHMDVFGPFDMVIFLIFL